ncbi:MAG TPA: response regulator [archaeon]|nr:response regulator [archaeon]
MKILLVDDDNAVLNVVSRFLIEENCSVKVAADGEEAFKLIEEDLPDVVMTDIKMPVMDGLELLKACKKKYDIPFIMFTGYADMDTAIEALNNGAYYFLHKPINFYEIMAVLNHLREKIRLERKLEEQRSKLFQMSRLADLGLLTDGLVREVSEPVNCIIRNLVPLKNNLSRIEKYLLTKKDEAPGESEKTIGELLSETPQIVEMMEKESTNVSNILHEMGIFAGLISMPDSQLCDLNECIEETLKMVLVGSKIEVKKSLGDNVVFKGSMLQISQLLIILLTNAREALENVDHKTIEITSYRDENSVFLQFANNGPGIPEEDREKIFTPFFTTKEHERHKGLGLSIAYGIVVRAGGEISCRCPETGGTIFTICLPAPKAE